MIIGNKLTFAIEIIFDEFYDDDYFIGMGIYRVYINGYGYGLNKSCATYFCMIKYGFTKMLTEKFFPEYVFINYKDLEIAKDYLDCFNNPELSKEKFLSMFFDLRDYAGSAFDDNSCVLVFNDCDDIKLLGFKLIDENNEIDNLNSITLKKSVFIDIIQKSLNYITEQQRINVEKGNFVEQ